MIPDGAQFPDRVFIAYPIPPWYVDYLIVQRMLIMFDHWKRYPQRGKRAKRMREL